MPGRRLRAGRARRSRSDRCTPTHVCCSPPRRIQTVSRVKAAWRACRLVARFPAWCARRQAVAFIRAVRMRWTFAASASHREQSWEMGVGSIVFCMVKRVARIQPAPHPHRLRMARDNRPIQTATHLPVLAIALSANMRNASKPIGLLAFAIVKSKLAALLDLAHERDRAQHRLARLVGELI